MACRDIRQSLLAPGAVWMVQQAAGSGPDVPDLLYTILTALHRDAVAAGFLIPPTVRTLSLSLNTATSGAVASRSSEGKDTQTRLVTYDLL